MAYDLVVIGGGLAGAGLGRALALAGARVLILERETRFRDRVRGESIHPWGVAEARALGLAELLLDSCAQEVRWWRGSVVGTPGVTERDLVATTPARAGELTFYHPAMQETLLRAAADAGAEVRRGARAVGVAPGGTPAVQFQASGGAVESAAARLIVAADGRDSPARRWAGFAVNRDLGLIRFFGPVASSGEARLRAGLELHGAQVAERGMQALAIVPDLDVLEDRHPGRRAGRPVVAVDQLHLERGEE